VAEKLLSLSRNIRTVMRLIADNEKSCAVAVTIPESMAVSETERLIRAIDKHKIRCAGLVVNMATDNSINCSFCSSRANFEGEWIKKAENLFKNTALTPYLTQDIRGQKQLKEFGKMVWG
jgi:anion-transporting  ArsA/GET3 family ATPase